MRIHELCIPGSIALCLLVAACSKSSPTKPTSTAAPAEADAVTGSVTVPQAVSPAANAQIRNVDQPVTLVVANADRKSVVYGKSVDLGGRRIIKKKKKRGRSRHATGSSHMCPRARETERRPW